MVDITNASTLMPKSITVVEDNSVVKLTSTPVDVSVNTGTVTIQTGGITSVNGDSGPVVVLDTGDIAENGNLYYTDARSRAAISATGDIAYNSTTGVISYNAAASPVSSVNGETGAVVLDTSDIDEGSNLYYTDGRVQTVIDTNTAGFITADSTDTLTNKSGAISQWTNDAGYLTSETDSQTLSFTSPNLTISNGNTVDLSALTPTTVDWSTVTNTPTTISGYGITDAFDGAFSSLTGTPTTIAGYGITDAFDGAFSSLTGTPTTLAGYGITDGYTDADVDGHLNTSTATTGEVLSWTGTDYDWITAGGGNPFDQDLNTTDSPEFVEVTADEFIGNLRGANLIQAQAGEALTKGDVVYISGISGNTPIVSKADADDAAKMPAVGLANATVNLNANVDVLTFGQISNIDTTQNIGGTWTEGDSLYVNTTAGQLTKTPPTGEGSLLQKIAKIEKVHASTGLLLIQGAGRTNATPNLNDGNIFLGNASNQSVSASLDTSVGAAGYIKNVVEDTTPQLGGELDADSNNIINVTNIGVNGTITGTNAFGIQMPDGIDLNGTGLIQSHNGSYQPVTIEGGTQLNNNSSGDYVLNIDHPNTTGRGIQVRQGISGTPQTSGQLLRLRSADAAGFAERFEVQYDGRVQINNSYTLPTADGTTGQVMTTDGAGNITFTTVSGGGSFSGDLAGNTFTDSTQALTTTVNKSSNPASRATGVASTTQMSAAVTIGQGDNILGTTNTFEIASDIPSGNENIHFDRTEHVFDTRGFSFVGDGMNGTRINLRHGNSDFATNGQGNINSMIGFQIDAGDNHNGTNDNTIENITGQRIRVRDDFDRTNLNTAIGLELSLDTNLSAANTFRSIISQNTSARLEHWGEARFSSLGGVRLAGGDNGQVRVINKLNQTAPMVQKNVDNNPSFQPIDKTIIDQNITDNTYVVDEVERGYYATHSTRATVVNKLQAPTASSTSTPQVGYGLEMSRPVYNANSAVTSSINDTLFSMNTFGSSGFWLSNGNLNVPARQSISFGFPINFQPGFDNPFVSSTGGTAVNNLLTENGQMPTRIVFSYNTGAVANFDAISDTAWTNTEMGVLNSVYDKLWSFGCSWQIKMESSIPSNAANATVVVNKALAPSGVIASFPGDTNGFVPLYANTPSWMNTSTRALTMTRPATGKTFYRWTIEFSDSTIFVKDWESFNLS